MFDSILYVDVDVDVDVTVNSNFEIGYDYITVFVYGCSVLDIVVERGGNFSMLRQPPDIFYPLFSAEYIGYICVIPLFFWSILEPLATFIAGHIPEFGTIVCADELQNFCLEKDVYDESIGRTEAKFGSERPSYNN